MSWFNKRESSDSTPEKPWYMQDYENGERKKLEQLRDEFAKAAMAEFIKIDKYRNNTFERISEASYVMADAMLQARKTDKGE